MKRLLFALFLTACGTKLNSPSLCYIPGADLGVEATICIMCTNTYCRGPENPPCSTCGDTPCSLYKIKDKFVNCCNTSDTNDPSPNLPVCKPSIGGSPGL